MKKRTLIYLILLILLTTITFQQRLIFSTFDVEEINIKNTSILEENDLKILLQPIYGKNIFFLKNSEIEKILIQINFVEGFNIKKKYPRTLDIRIFEKKPIAILINNREKFYLSDKIELINFRKLENFKNLPYILGNKDEFKIFYNNLKKINFPQKEIKRYILFESKRWDIETYDKKIIKLPVKNYTKSLENYIQLKKKDIFKKYIIFDYRINDQLILK